MVYGFLKVMGLMMWLGWGSLGQTSTKEEEVGGQPKNRVWLIPAPGDTSETHKAAFEKTPPARASASPVHSEDETSLQDTVRQQAAQIERLTALLKTMGMEKKPFVPSPADPTEALIMKHLIHPGLTSADTLHIVESFQRKALYYKNVPYYDQGYERPVDTSTITAMKEKTIQNMTPLIKDWMDARAIVLVSDILWKYVQLKRVTQEEASQAMVPVFNLLTRSDQVQRLSSNFEKHYGPLSEGSMVPLKVGPQDVCGTVTEDVQKHFIVACQTYAKLHNFSINSHFIPDILEGLQTLHGRARIDSIGDGYLSQLFNLVSLGLPARRVSQVLEIFSALSDWDSQVRGTMSSLSLPVKDIISVLQDLGQRSAFNTLVSADEDGRSIIPRELRRH